AVLRRVRRHVVGPIRSWNEEVTSKTSSVAQSPPAAAAVGTGAKRTGSASASRPSPPPRSAAAPAAGKRRFSPECRPNFAAADLPPPAAISGDQGMEIHPLCLF
ncbi:Ankyrin repeat family protein, partial [Prunus dulcis]